ncbi:MAG: arsenate reductase (glutaredoxin) [Rheinheimera sp.]
MLTIYHNNRCSKSREVLALLEQLGKPFQVVHYLNDPLNEIALRELLKQLQLSPRQLLRDKEDEFHSFGLADQSISDDLIIQAMLKEPKLMERPVVVMGNKAVIARPANRILELF